MRLFYFKHIESKIVRDNIRLILDSLQRGRDNDGFDFFEELDKDIVKTLMLLNTIDNEIIIESKKFKRLLFISKNIGLFKNK